MRTQGHYEVQFNDGLCGVGMYDKRFDDVIRTLARQDRPVKSIEWVSEYEAYNAKELAERIYELADPWDREYEPDDIAGQIIQNPLAVIEYLLGRLED